MAAPPSSVPAPAVQAVVDVARGRREDRRQAGLGVADRSGSQHRRERRPRGLGHGAAIEAETGSNGLNAATGEIVDLVKAGIIDPAKVTRAALQNAASIAALVLTTECLVADKPEPAGAGMGGGGMDPMGGMGGMM